MNTKSIGIPSLLEILFNIMQQRITTEISNKRLFNANLPKLRSALQAAIQEASEKLFDFYIPMLITLAADKIHLALHLLKSV